jgi:2-oxoglutarate ferredoxin oxidoreductase subunit gamma
LEKFAPTVKKGGIIFVNSSLISLWAPTASDVDELRVPVVDIAKDLGTRKGRQHRGPFRFRCPK